MVDDEQEHYGVQLAGARFDVVDLSERVIMSCHDESSAAHYAVLLNEAYRRGYKAGYRQARKV